MTAEGRLWPSDDYVNVDIEDDDEYVVLYDVVDCWQGVPLFILPPSPIHAFILATFRSQFSIYW